MAPPLNPSLKNSWTSHLPHVLEARGHLERRATLSMWTAVADPHHVPLVLGGAVEILDRRLEKVRLRTSAPLLFGW